MVSSHLVCVTVWDVSGLTNTSVATLTRAYGHHSTDRLRQAANRAAGKKQAL